MYPERVTTIENIPAQRDPDGFLSAPLYLTIHVVTADGIDYTTTRDIVWQIRQTPRFDIDPPTINTAYRFDLVQLGRLLTRTVSFGPGTIDFDLLIDVDPATLHPVPADEPLAEWVVVRDQILAALDIPDPTLIFENGLV